ncbi:hypothetical protein [Alistipes onderdonkii]|uniref:hypothetical protein n=1 Tax=Alistipes onderdonkii TaxID=328813 RepID=UPI0018A9F5E4|nr:hypothetical protein [Alistipes onderdonkii]
MAEFPRTTVPAAPAQVLFWQKGRGETEYAKREDGKKTGGRTRAPGGNRGDATQTGMQEKTEKKTEKKNRNMDASGSGDNGKYCGKTLRKPDNADEKDGTDGKDDTDDTEQYGRCELVRIGNPMDWQTVRRKRKKQRKRRKRRKDRAKKTGLRKRRPYDPARKPV